MNLKLDFYAVSPPQLRLNLKPEKWLGLRHLKGFHSKKSCNLLNHALNNSDPSLYLYDIYFNRLRKQKRIGGILKD